MKNLKMKINYYAPPGANIHSELTGYAIMLIIIFAISCSFLFSYGTAYDNLYSGRYYWRVLLNDAVMENINVLMKHSFAGIWIMAVDCIMMAVSHYTDFYRDTKSIYVMKRIPRKSELHRRCLVLPLFGFLAGVLFAAVLMVFYVFIYYHMTPAGCLPEYTSLDLWRILL